MFGEQTGYQIVTKTRPDISQYATFEFYTWIWHWVETEEIRRVGRWLGVAENIGQVMCF